MKFRLVLMVGALIMLNASQQLFSHIFSFSNHTNDPLKVRIQLKGVDEGWYEQLIPSKENQGAYHEFRFVAFEEPGDMARKFGLCLDHIQVALPIKKRISVVSKDGEDMGMLEEYIKDAQGNIQFGPWSNVIVKPVQNEGANAILKAAEGFADSLQDLAKDAASAYVNYKTK